MPSRYPPESRPKRVWGWDHRGTTIPHDVKVYPEAGHSFLNDHDPSDVPRVVTILSWLSRSRYHEASALDARRRIAEFFHRHLG